MAHRIGSKLEAAIAALPNALAPSFKIVHLAMLEAKVNPYAKTTWQEAAKNGTVYAKVKVTQDLAEYMAQVNDLYYANGEGSGRTKGAKLDPKDLVRLPKAIGLGEDGTPAVSKEEADWPVHTLLGLIEWIKGKMKEAQGVKAAKIKKVKTTRMAEVSEQDADDYIAAQDISKMSPAVRAKMLAALQAEEDKAKAAQEPQVEVPQEPVEVKTKKSRKSKQV